MIVTGGSAERIAWGDWGEAVMLAMDYAHPRTTERVSIRQAVSLARQQAVWVRGHRGVLGVMPSGRVTTSAERPASGPVAGRALPSP